MPHRGNIFGMILKNTPPKDFFISYNNADSSWAEWIAWQLEDAGFTTVIQAWDFRPGSNFILEMQRAATQAKRTIAVISPDYLSAFFTQPEWAMAFAQDPTGEEGVLLPIRVRQCNLKGLLPQIIYIDLVGLEEFAAREALIAGVRRGRAKPPISPSFPDIRLRSVAKPKRYPGDTSERVKITISQLTITALHQLPPPPRDFTGRASEITELMAALQYGGVTISGLRGMAGIGKTALALVLADQLTSRYPEVQFYLDLKGTSKQPLSTADAMAYIIRSFNREDKLPESVEKLSGLYQSVLRKKSALLLMDNAANAEQVIPLIPPTNCVLLITSRQHFTLPGLFAKNLDTLSSDDAHNLLLKIAPRIGNHADNIAKLCGYLPLALRLAGGALFVRGDLSVTDYVRRLSNAHQRLKFIDSSRSLIGEPLGVEASLNLSYELLNMEMQRLWCALAVFPDTFDISAAAAVWELGFDQAQDTLSVLVAYSLVEWNPATVRYHLHDLARLFADSRLSETDRSICQRCHSSHYLSVIRESGRLWEQGGQAINYGLALFDLEWSNIQAGQAWAAAHAAKDDIASELCSDYPDVASDLLALRLSARERVRWRETALSAARKLNKRDQEGKHSANLGVAYHDLGENHRAIQLYDQALSIYRELGFRRGEGDVLGNLGNAYIISGETRRAIQLLEQALVIHREMGERLGEANDQNNLGIVYEVLGEFDHAIKLYEQALAIYREIGRRMGEGAALGNLGSAYYQMGEPGRAIEFFEHQLAIAREIGDLYREANALRDLGSSTQALNEPHRSIEFLEQSLIIYRDIGYRQGETDALESLGETYAALGESHRARQLYEQAIFLAREINYPSGEGETLRNMSLLMDRLNDRVQAIALAEAALRIFAQIEDRRVAIVRKQLAEWNEQK